MLLARAERPDFLQRETVDLETLGEELLAKAHGLGAREWRLEASASGTVVADRQRLTQAVINLAENAVRHTDGGDAIALGTSLSQREARIWVKDQGPGVPIADQRRVFERFTRGANTRDGSDEGSGAGLGLAIVRAIAAAHGGRVELDSTPGAGARFTIVFPPDGIRGDAQ
jgi:two-component system OmpR family sensor kinase